MLKLSTRRWYSAIFFGAIFLILGQTVPIKAQPKPASSNNCNCASLYNPILLVPNQEITDTLSDKDIPSGEGGFARDYQIELKKGDQIAIDLTSDDFDSLVMLLAADGSNVTQNDDGPDGSTNSLLFFRITEDGKYIVRVRAFGETSEGAFKLKLNQLTIKPSQPVRPLKP
jgi:hypothetical protein